MQFGITPYDTATDTLCSVMRLQMIESMPEAHVIKWKFENSATTGYDIADMKIPGKARLGEAWSDLRKTQVLWIVDEESMIDVSSNSEHSLYVDVVAPTVKRAATLMGAFSKHVKYRPLPPLDRVDMKFWHQTQMGPSTVTREIDVPPWDDIHGNYSASASDALTRLMELQSTDLTAGRIILMHGPAGTGKTTAIRALARQWRNWCNFEYVIDPDELFGDHGAAYLVHVVLENQQMLETPDGDGHMHRAIPWRLLVIEDAEEFIRADAKARVGQALARLLNIGDGLIGQGLKVLTLLTTNAEVGTLHPAITRAGRCIANIEVPALTKTECAKWMLDQGHQELVAPKGDSTLADLYQITREHSQIGNEKVSSSIGQYL